MQNYLPAHLSRPVPTQGPNSLERIKFYKRGSTDLPQSANLQIVRIASAFAFCECSWICVRVDSLFLLLLGCFGMELLCFVMFIDLCCEPQLFPTAALVVCVHDGHWDVRLLPVVSTTVPSDIFLSAVVVAGFPPLSWFVLCWACTCQAGAPPVRCGDTRRRFFSSVVGHSCFFFGQINSELLLIKNKRIGYLFLTCKHFVYSGYNSFVECILEKYSLNRWHIGPHFS